MNRLFVLLVVFSFLAAIAGCDEPDEIRQYRIAKSRSDLGDIGKRKVPLPPQRTAVRVAVESRMVVGIAEREDAMWFFKITGPVKAVDESEPQWTELLSNVEFDDTGKPTWTLSDGWSEGPPRQMRYATLITQVKDQGKVEISISSLGPNQDLLDNVNRWRRQLALLPVDKESLNLTTLESAAGELKIFDAKGKLAGGSPMSLPPVQPAENTGLIYDTPSGWTKGRTNPMVPIRLVHGDEKTSPQIKVTQLIAEANKWMPNAQQWAAQTGMSTDEKSLEDITEDFQVDSIDGKKIRLISGDETKEIAIIAVMINRDELTWFFKFTGSPEFVRENESAFDEFLSSFKFE